jgi:hypothetical protein
LTPSYQERQEEIKKLLKIGQKLPIKKQILKILDSLPNKEGTIQNLLPQVEQTSICSNKKIKGAINKNLGILIKVKLIKVKEKQYNKITRRYVNIYKLTKKGENFLLNFNEFIPVDLKYPYILFNEAILPAITKWQQLNWKTPLINSELTNWSILPVTVFFQALSAYDLIKVELKNGIDISLTVLSISNKGKEFLTELIILLTPLIKLIESSSIIT